MKKTFAWLVRIIMVVVICASCYLMLKSSITINVPDVRGMTRTVLAKNAEKTNQELQASLKLAQKTGLEDKVLQQLPKQYHYDLSYSSLDKLGVTYEANGELTAKNLNLPQNNKVEQVLNHYILKNLNQQLNNNDKLVEQLLTIFHYVILAIILAFLLAALMVVFGKYGASIVLLIAAIGSFGILQYCVGQLVHALQVQLTTKITLLMATSLWLALILGIAGAIIWPICLHLTKSKPKNEI